MSSGNFQKAFLNNFTIFITLKENKIILHHLVSEPGYLEYGVFLMLTFVLVACLAWRPVGFLVFKMVCT